MFKLKPKSNRPNAVILYLARSSPKDYADLKESLRLLHENFNRRFHYPIIVFHEDFGDGLKKEIQEASGTEVTFEQIQFALPDFLNKEEIPAVLTTAKWGPWPLGYRHMCRFFSGLIYQNPVLKDYDWYWRLDTDSFILSKINYDVFQFMEKKGFVYGYRALVDEAPEVVVDLWNSVKAFIDLAKIEPISLEDFLENGEWNSKIFFNNFEISRFSLWRSDPYQKFFNYLDKLGGIYKRRWGDAPIHTFAVGLFLRSDQTHQFSDITYKHLVEFSQTSPTRDFFKRCLNRLRG